MTANRPSSGLATPAPAAKAGISVLIHRLPPVATTHTETLPEPHLPATASRPLRLPWWPFLLADALLLAAACLVIGLAGQENKAAAAMASACLVAAGGLVGFLPIWLGARHEGGEVVGDGLLNEACPEKPMARPASRR
jgi:hypothetical protein